MAITSESRPCLAGKDLPDLLDEVLDASVAKITGDPQARARPGQRTLSHDILAAMLSGRYLGGEAPTGSGKGLAYLAPAMLLAAVQGQRAVISTETLGLQAQIIDKDAPVIAAAVAEALDCPPPSVAVLKGWANFACGAAVASTLGEMVGVEVASTAALIGTAAGLAADGATVRTLPLAGRGRDATARKDSTNSDGLVELVTWAAGQIADDGPGDRGTYPGSVTEADWQQVSVTPAECPGAARCRFGESCRPAKARASAADADIVVTNHSMLATQAARSVPVVLGNETLGDFAHLVVDEAHALPAKVRDQGSVNVNAFRLAEAVRAVGKVMAPSQQLTQLSSEAIAVATALDSHLTSLVGDGRSGASRFGPAVVKVGPDDQPLEPVGSLVGSWVARARRIVPKASSAATSAGALGLYRAHAKLEALMADMTQATEHRSGVARWVEAGRQGTESPPGRGKSGWSGATLKLAPINTSGALRNNLYAKGTGAATDSLTGMSVTALSATLPVAAVSELGLANQRTLYPSPFTDAYDSSLLFVPRPDLTALARPGSRSLDTGRHPGWAAPMIEALVTANGGSALVVAATVAAGKLYAERLRALAASTKADWAVHSQWDGPALPLLVSQWRADHSSVLVGTKSLMTGVDAPGGTCSLVIVDRVPRAAGNPVDDARVADLVERLDLDRYIADRLVYVADAALLLEQAAGRLIRSETDGGVVAVLDPRLLRVGGMSYQASTRDLLLGALARFEHRSTDLATTCGRLSRRSGPVPP